MRIDVCACTEHANSNSSFIFIKRPFVLCNIDLRDVQ